MTWHYKLWYYKWNHKFKFDQYNLRITQNWCDYIYFYGNNGGVKWSLGHNELSVNIALTMLTTQGFNDFVIVLGPRARTNVLLDKNIWSAWRTQLHRIATGYQKRTKTYIHVLHRITNHWMLYIQTLQQLWSRSYRLPEVVVILA